MLVLVLLEGLLTKESRKDCLLLAMVIIYD
uniref:Uncharacterized protein n=1 Tax=Amphimedon queenslandica TaxID=400682 RepID=A0A1X7T7C5_AMPQE